MKLPLYFSQEPGPHFPSAQLSHDEPQYMRQVGEQLEHLGRIGERSLQQVMGPLIERERQEKELDILKGASLKDNYFALASQDILSEERQNFKDRDAYHQNVDKRLSRVIQDIASRYPKEYQAHAQRQIMDRMTAIHNEDQQWSDARWLEQKQGEMLTVLDRKKQDILDADRRGDTAAMVTSIGEARAILKAQDGITIPRDKFPAFQEKYFSEIDQERASADASSQTLGNREDYPNLDDKTYESFRQEEMKLARQDWADQKNEEAQRKVEEKEQLKAAGDDAALTLIDHKRNRTLSEEVLGYYR